MIMPYLDFIKNNTLLVIGFIALVFTMRFLIASAAETHRQRKQFIWEQKTLGLLKHIDQARQEEKKYDNSIVCVENKFLNYLKEHSRIFVFSGEPGNGKTESMKMFSKWLLDVKEHYDIKNRTYNKFMRPEYIREKQKLIDEELLNVYDNMGVILDGLKSQPDVMDVLRQYRKAAEDAVLMLDEAGHDLPKEVYFQIIKLKNKDLAEEFAKIVEFIRFIRHYINGYLLMSEQDEDHIYIGVRRTGYKKITCLGMSHYLSKKGLRVKARKKFFNAFTPAFLHHPIRAQFQLLGIKRRIIQALISIIIIIPNFFNKRIYFEGRDAINIKCKERYELHKALWLVDSNEHYLIWNNQQTFRSESRLRRGEYQKHFTAGGYSNIKRIVKKVEVN
jgi:hypothetical protein